MPLVAYHCAIVLFDRKIQLSVDVDGCHIKSGCRGN